MLTVLKWVALNSVLPLGPPTVPLPISNHYNQLNNTLIECKTLHIDDSILRNRKLASPVIIVCIPGAEVIPPSHPSLFLKAEIRRGTG